MIVCSTDMYFLDTVRVEAAIGAIVTLLFYNSGYASSSA